MRGLRVATGKIPRSTITALGAHRPAPRGGGGQIPPVRTAGCDFEVHGESLGRAIMGTWTSTT